MPASSRRSVITGIGVISPLGTDPESFWQALLAGKSGVQQIRTFDTSGLPVHIAGEITGFDARTFVARQDRLSTPEADIWEACGLQAVFGDSKVPLLAVKSYLGNLGAGAGTSELTASLLALERGVVPPTLNYEEPGPSCPIRVLSGELRPVSKPHALKVSFTEMGQCAAVVCRKWE